MYPVRTEPERFANVKAAAPERIWLCLAVALAALTFIGTLRFAFVYDDLTAIVNNPRIESWRYFGSFFSHHLSAHLYATGNYYRPLYLVWFTAVRTVFGLNTVAWHAATLACHLAATVATFYLARRVTQDGAAASFAALIFGVHPVHIETVAWVSASCDSLVTALMIAAYLQFAGARARPEHRLRKMIVSTVLYGVALLVKEPAIVLPAILAAHEWMWGEDGARRSRRTIASVLPYLAVAVVYLVVRAEVLGGFLHVDRTVSAATFLWTLPSVTWLYLKHLVWPVGISAFYDTPFVARPGVFSFVLPLAGCAAVAVALWLGARRSRAAAMASLWMILPLLPALAGIATSGSGDIAHDRYLYVSSAGFCILAAMALRRLPASGGTVLGLPAMQAAGVLLVAAGLAAGSATQSVQWASNVLLFHRAVEHAPGNALARIELASAMMGRGDVASAMRLYREAHDLAPEEWLPNFLLGYANYSLGSYAEAERYLRAAIRISPANSSEFLYLGLTLAHVGRFEEAESVLREGLATSNPPSAALLDALKSVTAHLPLPPNDAPPTPFELVPGPAGRTR